MTPTLKTRRLILRPLELADAEQTQRIFPHWEVVRFLANRFPWPYPADGALTYYRDIALPAVARGEEWHWTLRLKADPDQHIGCVALIQGESGNRGFWLGERWHRQGLMSEAVDAIDDFWFTTLGFAEMRVTKATANTGSRRISEKNGMRLVATHEGDYISGRLPTEVWAITAEEWRRRKNP
ncbi:MAG: GNAT family N-acetyltransferase [Acidobacteriota bacterium]|nr:GNAT family N-acetyltransferase [Acidobacteriota bacterium]